jgi:thioredoxin reductase (NADPH)
MSLSLQSALDQRRDQVFLKFDPADIERMRGFGDVRSFAAGERLTTAGQVAPGLFIILTGRVAVAEQRRRCRAIWSTASTPSLMLKW